jgi:ATP-binding cassette subfamily F protein uup
MDRLVDHLFVFDGDGVIRDFPGNYSQYRMSLEELPVAGYQLPVKEKPTGNREPETGNTKRRLSFKEKREFDLLEKEIADLNREKEMIAQKFNDGNLPFEKLQDLSQRIGEVSTLLDAKEMRWLELSEMIEGGDR